MAATPTALVPIADGSEEIEAVSIIDTLVRGGVQVTVASVMPGQNSVRCSRGVSIAADCNIEDVRGRSFDLIALPGGMPGAVCAAPGVRRRPPEV